MTLYVVVRLNTVYDLVPASFLDYYDLPRVVAQGDYKAMCAARRLLSSQS